jgi:hypothetical protein
MAAPAIALTHARPAPAWIIGRRSDLACLIGGAAVSYALLTAHVAFGVPAVVLYMLWVLVVDGPHVFATVSRTYLDPEERRTRGPLLRGSLWFFAIGPAAVVLSVLAQGRLPFDGFLVVCSLWAYWHVVRQHYGVMVLYKKKAGDLGPADDGIDRLALYVGLLAPFVSYVVTSPDTLERIGLAVPLSSVALACWGLVAAVLVTLGLRQLVRVRAGQAINVAKLLFLAAAVSVSVVLFSPPVGARIQYQAVFPIVTSFHNVQYLAIVWFFHQNRVGPRRPVPSIVARSLVAFLGAGVLFTVGYRVLLGCVFSTWPGCDLGAQELPIGAGLTASDAGVAFLWGFALHHYYLDQRIWHVRRDAGVSRALRLEAVG